MATEYKLPYSGSEIHRRLRDVDTKASIVPVSLDEHNSLVDYNANALYVVMDEDGGNDEYYTQVQIDERLEEINGSIAAKADASHNHDDRYYTEEEMNTKLDEIDTRIDGVSGVVKHLTVTYRNGHSIVTDPDGDIWDVIVEANANGKPVTCVLTHNDGTVEIVAQTMYLPEEMAVFEAWSYGAQLTLEVYPNGFMGLDDYNYVRHGIYAPNRVLTTITDGFIMTSDITTDELSHLSGVTSNIQTQLDNKSDADHTHTISEVENLQESLNDKASVDSLANYYTKEEIDNMELVSIADIDTICSATIQMASLSNEVKF